MNFTSTYQPEKENGYRPIANCLISQSNRDAEIPPLLNV